MASQLKHQRITMWTFFSNYEKRHRMGIDLVVTTASQVFPISRWPTYFRTSEKCSEITLTHQWTFNIILEFSELPWIILECCCYSMWETLYDLKVCLYLFFSSKMPAVPSIKCAPLFFFIQKIIKQYLLNTLQKVQRIFFCSDSLTLQPQSSVINKAIVSIIF